MKDAYYFPHDSNAKNDPKMVALVEELGFEGTQVYWILNEIIRAQPDYKYPLCLLPALARKYLKSKEKIETVVRNYDLSQVENTVLFLSPSQKKRLSETLF